MSANDRPLDENLDDGEVHTFCPICGDGYLYGYKVVCAACLAAGKTEDAPETAEESLARLEQDLSRPDDPRDEFFADVDRFDGYDCGDGPEQFCDEQTAEELAADEDKREAYKAALEDHNENPPF